MELADHVVAIALLFLAGIYPVIDAKRFRKKLEGIEASTNGGRIKIYQELLCWLWGTSALVIGFWVYKGYAFSELGFRVENTLGFWLGGGVALILSIIMLSNYYRLKGNAKVRKETLAALNKTSAVALMPRNKKELKYWAVCSISASSEEIVYRGFIFWYVASQTNSIIAGLVSCLLFSIAHAYQGWKGMIQTGIYGVILLALYLVSDSLWPPILLHIVQDFSGGLAGYICFNSSNNMTSELASHEKN